MLLNIKLIVVIEILSKWSNFVVLEVPKSF